MNPVLLPTTLSELWPLMQKTSGALLFCGGTDLLVRLRAQRQPAPPLICLERLEEISRIEEGPETVAIGAGVSPARLLASPLLTHQFPVLAQALSRLGSPQIRNMASLGGNIMSASPAADSLPPLYILGAEVELRGVAHCRRLPLPDFILGPGRTRLERGEILSRILLPRRPTYNHHYFEKVGLRQALAIAVVSLAAVYNLTEDGVVTDIRLAWGSIGPTVVTLPAVEEFLRHHPLERDRLAAAQVTEQIRPISDLRASADYRRRVAGRLLLRLSNLPETRP